MKHVLTLESISTANETGLEVNLMDCMTAKDLYIWAKERGLENLPILTFDSYGELCHSIDSEMIETRNDNLVI